MKVAPAGGMSVDGKEFKNEVTKIIQERKPKKIIETGTYLGTGTTTIISKELEKLNYDYQFFTIEPSPDFFKQAVNNLKSFHKISVCNAYSIPKSLFPNSNQLKEILDESENEDIYVDFQDHERISCYMNDQNYNVPDDFLKICLRFMNYSCDLFMLDSSGHIGYIEFNYILSLLKSSCIFILDDVNHFKHYKSLNLMKNDKRFKILKKSDEKFGFCIAEFNI